MALVESLSRPQAETTESEQTHRLLALRVLKTRADRDHTVKKFVAKYLTAELRQSDGAPPEPEPDGAEAAPRSLLWGTACFLEEVLQLVRSGQAVVDAFGSARSVEVKAKQQGSGWGRDRASNDAELARQCLPVYLSGADPTTDKFEDVSYDALPEEALRHDVFRMAMAAVCSTSLRAHSLSCPRIMAINHLSVLVSGFGWFLSRPYNVGGGFGWFRCVSGCFRVGG